MSYESYPQEGTGPDETKPERKLNREHYARLMKGQEPWFRFRRGWKVGGDCRSAFENQKPEEFAAIRGAVEDWNLNPPEPAMLEGADLSWARLEGADLDKAILRGADMAGCDLKAANLANADLTDVVGLTAGQIAGADVTSADLPEEIKHFESLRVADEAAKNSRSLFLIMLLACVYSWLTLTTTTDQALIMDTGSSLLPIIRVPVPIRGFFFAAPVFLLGAYAYFHLYLHGLWSRLAELPAIFPDGRTLDQRAYPWLLTSLVRPHFERLLIDRRLFSKAKVTLAILLAWWVVPFTIYLFWARALAAHVWYLTALHFALFIASLAVGVITYRGAIATLQLEDPPVTRLRDVARQVVVGAWGGIPIATVLLALLSALALWGPRELISVPVIFHPYADLTDAHLSTHLRPAFQGDDVEDLPAGLSGRNFHFAVMRNVHLEEADLSNADLSGADLRDANLVGANLSGANLSGAKLSASRADASMPLVAFVLHSTGARHTTELTKASLESANVTGVRDGSPTFWRIAAESGATCTHPSTGLLVPFEAPEDDRVPDNCRQ